MLLASIHGFPPACSGPWPEITRTDTAVHQRLYSALLLMIAPLPTELSRNTPPLILKIISGMSNQGSCFLTIKRGGERQQTRLAIPPLAHSEEDHYSK